MWVQESASIIAGVGTGVGAGVLFGVRSCVGLAASLGVGAGRLVLCKTERVGFFVGWVKHCMYGMERRSKPVSRLWILLGVHMCTVSLSHIRMCEVASKVSLFVAKRLGMVGDLLEVTEVSAEFCRKL